MKPNTVKQRLEQQIKEKDTNKLADIVGKWAGDEPDEEFEQMLKYLD